MSQVNNAERVLVNKKGRELTVTRTDSEAFKELECHVSEGEASKFAQDLVQKGLQRGLTDEQFWWVHQLVYDIENPAKVLTFPNITASYARGSDNMVSQRSMKLMVGRVEIDDDHFDVQLSWAGRNSKHHGSVWVTLPKIDKYCGRIGTDSTFYKVRDCPEEVVLVLSYIEDNVEKVLPW